MAHKTIALTTELRERLLNGKPARITYDPQLHMKANVQANAYAPSLKYEGNDNMLNHTHQVNGYIAQWLERLTADQQVPGSNPGVPSFVSVHPRSVVAERQHL